MKGSEDATQVFNQYRWLLFSIAYRMLGSATDAEDIVQEAFVRWLQASEEEVKSPRAYLSTVVVHLCIDFQRSAQARREVYVGPYLPEPLGTHLRPELIETPLLAESLSFAFLVLLESLPPLERAVFLLREVFEYNYDEIATIVGKGEANCRQILHRAREHLEQRQRRFEVSPDQQERITYQFMQASNNGDMQGLLKLLADDIVFTGDSNGKVRAGLKPVKGRDKVARGMLGGLRLLAVDMETRIEEINAQPAIVGYVNGRPFGVVLLDIEGGLIQHVYAVLNPDKLSWLAAR
ncbi:RNA polymerase sigma-70 factor [Ktedonosporobacter rubrisoli]|uniref:RNA polymerase sigma-70 factor n=1 Tax=Ktedonosporobacter rubrisoli TaxID=2509675 RepID=UPI001F5CD618|nr:RNA polymerase sigma-70 factor [Ktedonosporobacter rubrisoli]